MEGVTGHLGQQKAHPVGAGVAETVFCSVMVEQAGCSVGQRKGVELGPTERWLPAVKARARGVLGPAPSPLQAFFTSALPEGLRFPQTPLCSLPPGETCSTDGLPGQRGWKGHAGAGNQTLPASRESPGSGCLLELEQLVRALQAWVQATGTGAKTCLSEPGCLPSLLLALATLEADENPSKEMF